MERPSALEEGYKEIDVSREQSLGEEDKIFMGKALLLKCSSCSMGNFTSKFLRSAVSENGGRSAVREKDGGDFWALLNLK